METEEERATAAFRERMKMLAAQFGGVSGFARAAGLGESTVRKWTEGPSEPNRSKLVLLAQTAGVSAGWLATGEGSRDGSRAIDPITSSELAGSDRAEGSWTAAELATVLAIGAAVGSVGGLSRTAQAALVLRVVAALRALSGGTLPLEHEIPEADLTRLAELATALDRRLKASRDSRST